jgi:hypothetical protein
MLEDTVWRPLATELSGIAELRAGNEGAARTIFAGLVGDQASPPGLRARAAELLASLGGSVEDALTGGIAEPAPEDGDAAVEEPEPTSGSADPAE